MGKDEAIPATFYNTRSKRLACSMAETMQDKAAPAAPGSQGSNKH